jgi:predicted glycoside hydrolase/deacetylase ChbG (UPF0249 family)
MQKYIKNKLFIIVNADDLGENERVTRSIYNFAERGLISSASILVNGDDFDGAKHFAHNFPHISIGAHLNLTQFASLSKSDIFFERGIIDENNYFTGVAKYNSTAKIDFDRQLIHAVYNEWKMQLEKLYNNNISVSHIDGHNNIHYRYELLFALKKLQKEFNINKVRAKDVKPISFYGLFNKSLKRKLPPLKKEISNLVWNSLVKNIEPFTKTTDHVFSYLSLCNYLSTGSRSPRKGIFELVVHPGSNYLDYFLEENVLVEKRKIEELLPDFTLISYNEI